MNNETKLAVRVLEARIQRLESILGDFGLALDTHRYVKIFCPACAAYDPIEQDYTCPVTDCCMGLNPNDDKENL